MFGDIILPRLNENGFVFRLAMRSLQRVAMFGPILVRRPAVSASLVHLSSAEELEVEAVNVVQEAGTKEQLIADSFFAIHATLDTADKTIL